VEPGIVIALEIAALSRWIGCPKDQLPNRSRFARGRFQRFFEKAGAVVAVDDELMKGSASDESWAFIHFLIMGHSSASTLFSTKG